MYFPCIDHLAKIISCKGWYIKDMEEHLQQSPNNIFSITGIGRCPNRNSRIIGGLAFAVFQ